jgi:hypothetical protein
VKIRRFIAFSSLIAVIYALIAWLVTRSMAPDYSFVSVFIALITSMLTTWVAYAVTYSGLEKNTNQFVALLLTGMLAKMLVGIITILVVSLRFKPVMPEYVVAYFIGYFLFTGFEVYGLIRKLRPNF